MAVLIEAARLRLPSEHLANPPQPLQGGGLVRENILEYPGEGHI